MNRFKSDGSTVMDINANKDNSIRQSNFELLRIIAMCMIIAMHYMTKGMQLPKLSVDTSLHNVAFRLLFAFCASAVNIYVFISGYFAIDTKWSIGKLIRLWLQVLLAEPLVLFMLRRVLIQIVNQMLMLKLCVWA